MMDRIRLDAMHERHRALTPAIAGAYEEAASVCLSRNHASPVEITLSDNGSEAAAEIAWIEPDSRIRDAWANATDATENGADGCVIAGIELLRHLFAVRRAATRPRGEYFVGSNGSGEEGRDGLLRP